MVRLRGLGDKGIGIRLPTAMKILLSLILYSDPPEHPLFQPMGNEGLFHHR